MSQEVGDLMSKPSKRRSSIIQQAKKNGIISQSGDILRGLSGTLQPSLMRLSSSTSGPKKGSLGAKSSLGSIAPTPSSSSTGRGHQSTTSAKGSSIPHSNQFGGSERKTFRNPTTSSTNKISGIPPIGRGYGGQKVSCGKGIPPLNSNRSVVRGKPPIHPNHQSKGKGIVDTFSIPSLRKSSSLDANNWSALMMTPSMTPLNGRSIGSKTPGSIKSWGSQNNLNCRDNVGKGFKIPGNKDTKQLIGMMTYVHSFLESQGYNNLPHSPFDLRLVSTNAYINMVTAVGQLLASPRYFMTAAKEDPTTKIVELAALLQYPINISKSHLKSANAQHAWPCCLTFLTWLCCRAETAYGQEPEKPINDLLNEGFPQIALENYLKIYEAERLGVNSQQVVDEELQKFRITVSEQLMGELGATVEDLVIMKEEKLRELDELANTPDPTKEVFKALEKTKKLVDETEEKIRDTEEKILLYTDVHTLQSQSETLKIQLQNLYAEVDNLRSQVKSQPIDRNKADKMMAEIEEMSKQRECLKTIHQNLQTDLDKELEKVIDLDAKFRQSVAHFTVVETFNTSLSNLKIDGLLVPVNPLTPEELDHWLTTVAKIHEKTERASQTWLDAIKREHQNIEDSTRRAEENLAAIKRQLETKKAYTNAGTKLQKDQERQKNEEVKKLETDLNKQNLIIETKEKQLLEEAGTKLSGKQLELQKLKESVAEGLKAKKAWESEIEDCHAVYLHAEALMAQKGFELLEQHRVNEEGHDAFVKEFLEKLKTLCPEAFDSDGNLKIPPRDANNPEPPQCHPHVNYPEPPPLPSTNYSGESSLKFQGKEEFEFDLSKLFIIEPNDPEPFFFGVSNCTDESESTIKVGEPTQFTAHLPLNTTFYVHSSEANDE